jgi:CRP-like cAMP-binding protein
LTEATQPTPLVETDDADGAFPRLSDAHVEALAAQGDRRRTGRGDILFREGERTYDLVVVLKGLVAIVEEYGGRGSGRSRSTEPAASRAS